VVAVKRIAGRVPLGAEEPLGGQLRRGFKNFARKGDIEMGYDGQDDIENVSMPDANIYTSQVRWDSKGEKHMIALDIDVPVQAFPSRTPGHSHLYIEKVVNQTDLLRLTYLLAELGIVEEGYANASAERGFTALRAPWMPKRKLVRKPHKVRAREAAEEAAMVAEYEAMAKMLDTGLAASTSAMAAA